MQYLIHEKRIYVDVKNLILELSKVPKDISKEETLEILNRELNKLVDLEILNRELNKKVKKWLDTEPQQREGD